MRGEVILLTRNIVIKGDTTNIGVPKVDTTTTGATTADTTSTSITHKKWGGTFFTADVTLFDKQGNSFNYSGMTQLQNVELDNMGQDGNNKAALNFQNSQRASSGVDLNLIDGCSIHRSDGVGMRLETSKNITI